MLNIVIPMAGKGLRFVEAGYTDPKPLIEIYKKKMIQIVIENLTPKIAHRFIFICRKEHLEKYDLKQILKSLSPGCTILSLNKITEGAACTVLEAKELINNNDELMIANCDQYIEFSINDYLEEINNDNTDGLIMTMKANDKKWSFIRYNKQNLVTEVVEKVVISDEATVGIYNFKTGSDFVSAANKMIKLNLRVNGEFYVAPTYNQLISDNKIIRFCNIGEVNNGMYGLGTPEDLNSFTLKKVLP